MRHHLNAIQEVNGDLLKLLLCKCCFGSETVLIVHWNWIRCSEFGLGYCFNVASSEAVPTAIKGKGRHPEFPCLAQFEYQLLDLLE
jgi:hypothetical protein